MADVKKNLGDEFMKAVEGMKFLGDPVEKMNAEQLLVVVGYLQVENERLQQRLNNKMFSTWDFPPAIPPVTCAAKINQET